MRHPVAGLAILLLVTPAAAQVALTGPAGHASFTADQLRALPQVALDLPGEHGAALHLSGPALWPLLAPAIDPNVHDHVRQVLTVTGQDGYTATVALGELDPAFEGKGAILALDQDGHPLPHPRLALPGDKRLGRDVRDVTGLAIR